MRSLGDALDTILELRKPFDSGEKLGTELFFAGPLFTTEGGHGTEDAKYLPEMQRAAFLPQFVRLPKTQEEARRQVDELAAQHVDVIKGILEAGVPAYPFNRMNLDILRAVVNEAHVKHLPVAIHTGDSKDVADAVSLGADSVDTVLIAMKSLTDDRQNESKGHRFDLTLSVAKAFTAFGKATRVYSNATRAAINAEGTSRRDRQGCDLGQIRRDAQRT